MKITSAALAFAAAMWVLTGSALADSKMDNMPGMAKSTTTAAQGYPARGVVKQVDAAAGKVTISHEAIKGLDWPAMTMTFTVKDKMLFHKLAVGKNVQFHVAKQGSDYVVTEVN
jgi:Cu(I)/Ag(I) efflux system protein CusF